MVNAHHDGRRFVLGRGREDNLLDASIDVRFGGIFGQESTSGLAQVLNAQRLPWDLRGVAGMGGLHTLTVDNQVVAINLSKKQFSFIVAKMGYQSNNYLQRSLPSAVDGIVLELVSHIVGISSSVNSQQT